MGCEIPMTKETLTIRIPKAANVEATSREVSQIFSDGCYDSEVQIFHGIFGLIVALTIFITYSSVSFEFWYKAKCGHVGMGFRFRL
jgi:hypothetical protein